MKTYRVCFTASVLVLASMLCTGLATAENLFSESRYQSFVSDKKAYRIGDTLVLLIIESSTARSEADRSVDRSYQVGAGYELNGVPESAAVDVGVDRDAADSTGRAGNLKATMTVAVVGIDPVGNLEVSGQQQIVLNGKEQLIAVEGVVRPIDVASDNSILSNRLGNARIQYDGYDVDGDGEKRNWLYRTLTKIGLI